MMAETSIKTYSRNCQTLGVPRQSRGLPIGNYLFLDKSAIFGFKACMPEWIAIIILGIIEGITEFLPISSTAHLLIAEHWLPRQSDLFNIVIQSGAVIAVLPLFPERLHQFAFQWRQKSTQDYASKILIAFFITGVGVSC